jgi:hydroxymethylglutaryl-CoA reductase (NADPH)
LIAGIKIASFLTLHILNLCTPLTPQRYSTQALDIRKVDITATGVRRALTALAESEKAFISEYPEKQLFVKVSAPVYIHVMPPPAFPLNANSGSVPQTRTTSDLVENFMSTWTRLVGDPILSKWIIMVLAVSVSLNGYLLKGIAAGLAGKGIAGKESVRFVGAPAVDDMKAAWSTLDEKDPDPEPEPEPEPEPKLSEPAMPIILAPSAIAPAHRQLPKFSLDGLNERLKLRNSALHAPLSSESSSSSSSYIDDLPAPVSEPVSAHQETSESEHGRSLAECIDIFENGPRPVSVSLSLLTDEEIVLLAQSGKIAAYALEKVLDSGKLDNRNLERAVRIRRSLICEHICAYKILDCFVLTMLFGA